MLDDKDLDEFRPRRRRVWPRRVLLGLFVAIAALVVYARFVEPRRIEVTKHALAARVTSPIKIAHITDLHTSGFGPLEQKLVFLVRQENPDLIVITGDTVDAGDLRPARDFLANLSAPLGVWIVRGNWENWTVKEDERTFYSSLGARFLVNEGALARKDIWIAGLDDPASGKPDLAKALEGAPAAAFKLVLLHSPDFFQEVGGHCDLALAGHTHGGQVVLPAFGPVWLPQGGKRYLRGWFTLNRSHLFVNRGIGTSVLPVRLRARPELAIINLRPN